MKGSNGDPLLDISKPDMLMCCSRGGPQITQIDGARICSLPKFIPCYAQRLPQFSARGSDLWAPGVSLITGESLGWKKEAGIVSSSLRGSVKCSGMNHFGEEEE